MNGNQAPPASRPGSAARQGKRHGPGPARPGSRTLDQPRLLDQLADLAQAMSAAPDLAGIYRALWRFVEARAPCNGFFVALYDDERQERHCVYSAGDGEEDDVSALPPLPLTHSPQSRAIASGQIVVEDDFQAAVAGQSVVSLGLATDPRLPQSALAVPMIVHGRVIGGFEIQSVKRAAYRAEHLTAIHMAANLAAIATEHQQGLLREREHRFRAEQSEAYAQRQMQRLAALHRIATAITTTLDRDAVLRVVLAEATASLGADAASVLLCQPAQPLTFAAGWGFRGARAIAPIDGGYAGQAARERQVVLVPDVAAAPVGPACAAWLVSEGFRSYVGVPLIANDQVTGVLEIFHRTPFASDDEWLGFLAALAGQAAIAITNAELFANLTRSNADLAHSYDATIAGWAGALDLRDKETEGHSRRVTTLTVALAQAMGMDEAALVHVRRGALLHDIGKMGVPDAILLKPGPLTDEEWVVMRQHPTLAYELLSPIAFLKAALEIPYCHHEKWDGTGYPRGLAGAQIPLAARIFAVVDVWDAMRSDRPYRAAWPAERVRAHIQSLAGTHFDPAVVEVFLRITKEIAPA